jgi:carboxypeptidase Taq
MKISILDTLFSSLKKGLKSLIEKYQDVEKPDLSFLHKPVSRDVQELISAEIIDLVKYDLDRGRLDESEHPFTSGMYDDVRITTHYHESNFMTSSLFTILHESGHALYEQNLPRRWRFQPIGTACSMGIHESMSRFMENIVGRSRAFWTYFLPKLRKLKLFPESISLDDLLLAVNDVRPSKIRIEADEVTYSLHVILRFELEKDIMNNKLDVSEIPTAWNEKMESLLGITIDNDAEGCLQDTHWAKGNIGYFPDYALGNIYDGMYLKVMPEWENAVAAGDLTPVFRWLKSNIYARGNLINPADLIKLVTGMDLDAKPFIDYLSKKMQEIHP